MNYDGVRTEGHCLGSMRSDDSVTQTDSVVTIIINQKKRNNGPCGMLKAL